MQTMPTRHGATRRRDPAQPSAHRTATMPMYVDGAMDAAASGATRDAAQSRERASAIATRRRGRRSDDAQARDRGRAQGLRRRPVVRLSGARPRARCSSASPTQIDAHARRVRAHRHAQQRQAAARDRVRRRRRGQLLPLLRGPRDQAARPDLRRSGAVADVHRARADRRLRADRAVELSAADGACGSSRRRWPPATSACSSRPELTPLSAIRLAHDLRRARVPARASSTSCSAPGPTVGARARRERARGQDRVYRRHGDRPRDHASGAVGNLKKISLELGGKSPNIVFADADFDTAVDYALFGIYANAGQVCSAGSRLVVATTRCTIASSSAWSSARRRFASATASIRRPRWARSSRARTSERVEGYIAAGSEEGATLLCGGTRLGGALGGTETSSRRRSSTTRRPQMRIVQEEIFGPVLVVQTLRRRSRGDRASPTTRSTVWPARSSPRTSPRRIA